MKKIFTFVIALLAISTVIQAQTGWDNYKVTTTTDFKGNALTNPDTMYVAIACRNGKYQSFASSVAGTLYAMGTPTAYNAGDSVTWKIVKGAAIGTTPRVRFINVRTGEYLYQGLKGGTTKVAYVAPLNDPYKGVKDFELKDQGLASTIYYYFIADGTAQFYNDATGLINVKTNSTQGWKFIPKKGPQPKVQPVTPTLMLYTSESILRAGNDATLRASLIKKTTPLLGYTLLYRGTTLLDTLHLNADGNASYVFHNLTFGTEKFTLVYTGDDNYGADYLTITCPVIRNEYSVPTVFTVTAPATAQTHNDVVLDFTVKTNANADVTDGEVLVYFGNIAKNRIPVSAPGKAYLTIPNLQAKRYNIKAVYVGKMVEFMSSDTVTKTITVTPSVATVKAYPVTFDLAQQPEIQRYNRLYTTTSTTRPYSVRFAKDSVNGKLAGIIPSDSAGVVTYTGLALAFTSSDLKDSYANADYITVPLGSGYSKSIKFATPWLNEGSYNVYYLHRGSGDIMMNINGVSMDSKELYYSNEELTAREIRSYGAKNYIRRWNAKGHSANLGMSYLGSVRLEKSDIHNLQINVADENGIAIGFDMLQFVPVDMDSIALDSSAAKNFAKVYYPMFDLGGFARQIGEAAVTSFADITEMAIPYQVADKTVYTKKSHTITGLGTIIVSETTGNYVIVYRKDKWTRMAEGPIDEATKSFTCQLPIGDYYYQEINYIDMGTVGAAGYRTFISEGTFSVTNGTSLGQTMQSNCKTFVNGRTLTVKDIEPGARVYVFDFTGKMLINSVSNSSEFTSTLNPSVYVVKVVSAKQNFMNKVVIK